MSPEYGATIGFFPVDDQTLEYLRLTGRAEPQVRLIEAYCKTQGLFRTADSPDPVFTDTLELDLSTVEPSMAGPRRPQDRVRLLARNAAESRPSVKPWVKTRVAPGSKVVTEYLKRAGLTEYLERLRFHLVGYGCTTCIGNSGPMPEAIAAAVKQGDLVACAVL